MRRTHSVGIAGSSNSASQRFNIAFAGLTAAGKTTHALLLADELGYEYVSATKILLELLDMPAVDHRSVWFSKLDEINRLREGDALDDELEARLIQLATERDGLVLDTWALPWISDEPMIRIWVESDRRSRSWKCYVSQGKKHERDIETCAALIDTKDQTTREIFKRRHKFDLFSDRSRFDLILENTHLIDAPTREGADRGIEAFAPVVATAVKSTLHRYQHSIASARPGAVVGLCNSAKENYRGGGVLNE